MSRSISCVPFWNPERQITASTCLRVVGACVGITLIAIAILSLCNVSPLSQIGMPGPWVMLSCGVVSLLLSGVIKCINKRTIQSAQSTDSQAERLLIKARQDEATTFDRISSWLSSEMASFETDALKEVRNPVLFREVFVDIQDKTTQEVVLSQNLSDVYGFPTKNCFTQEDWKNYFFAALDIVHLLTPEREISVGLLIQTTEGKLHFLLIHMDAQTLLSPVWNETLILTSHERARLFNASIDRVHQHLKDYHPTREIPENLIRTINKPLEQLSSQNPPPESPDV